MINWLDSEGVMAEAMRSYQNGEDLCICTLIGSRGSVPQDLGAKMMVSRSGEIVGTIGGGKVEAAVIERAQSLLSAKKSEPVEIKIWNLQTDLGMSCGGEVTVLFENLAAKPPIHIAVFGAGHVGQALIPLLLTLNVRVTWLDDRQEWMDRGANENIKLKKIKVDFGSDLAPLIAKFQPNTYVVSVTKGHAFDLKVLRQVLPLKFPYVGVIGSKIKGRSLKQQLLGEGLSADVVGGFCCPIGEDFGDNQPAEIAISIVAQVLRVRDSLKK
ncbi:MAG: xanthine dehydrogenase accessory protein XdhC [Pseudomonadota bacterium]|jgi:xanthine dehydrogenase accessory factor